MALATPRTGGGMGGRGETRVMPRASLGPPSETRTHSGHDAIQAQRQMGPRGNSSGPDLYLERGTQVLDNAERKPLLYDARGRALEREMGFRR